MDFCTFLNDFKKNFRFYAFCNNMSYLIHLKQVFFRHFTNQKQRYDRVTTVSANNLHMFIFHFMVTLSPCLRLYSSHRRLALRHESIRQGSGPGAFFCKKRHCHAPVSECDNAFLAPVFSLLFFCSNFYQNLDIFRSVSDQILKALLGQCI